MSAYFFLKEEKKDLFFDGSFVYLQIRYRFGLYDEVTVINGCRVRHCNWIRFLRVSETYGPQVNILFSV